jgi:putative stress-induced transcription regulator
VLDFLATIAERGTTDEEKLQTPGDLADWALESGLTTGRPSVSAARLAGAIDLRGGGVPTARRGHRRRSAAPGGQRW